MTNILVADDQVLFCESLKTILESRTKDMKVVGFANTGKEAVEQVRRKRPDIVLMDIRMPEMSGVEATRAILSTDPTIRIIVLTTFDDDNYVHEAIELGAVGYLLKTIPISELISSIKAVLSGGVLVSPLIAKKMAQGLAPGRGEVSPPESRAKEKPYWLGYLSYREKEILGLMVKGLSNKEIGDRIFVVEQTVKNHLSVIYAKLEVHSRTQAIKKVIDANLRSLLE